jgi:hypothetical protein
VLLPLAIVALFALATLLPRWWVEPPRYDLIFSVQQDSAAFGVTFQRNGDQLFANVSYDHHRDTSPHHRLYHFRAADMSVVEIPITVPEALRSQLQIDDPHREFNVEELVVTLPGAFAVPAGQPAPDGYQVRNDHARGSGLFGALFGMGRRHSMLAIEKSGRVVEIRYPDNAGYYYYGVQPLGWLEPAGAVQ